MERCRGDLDGRRQWIRAIMSRRAPRRGRSRLHLDIPRSDTSTCSRAGAWQSRTPPRAAGSRTGARRELARDRDAATQRVHPAPVQLPLTGTGGVSPGGGARPDAAAPDGSTIRSEHASCNPGGGGAVSGQRPGPSVGGPRVARGPLGSWRTAGRRWPEPHRGPCPGVPPTGADLGGISGWPAPGVAPGPRATRRSSARAGRAGRMVRPPGRF